MNIVFKIISKFWLIPLIIWVIFSLITSMFLIYFGLPMFAEYEKINPHNKILEFVIYSSPMTVLVTPITLVLVCAFWPPSKQQKEMSGKQ